jgi:hypothetical protein
MSQDRPTAVELLESVRGFLTDEVVPVLDGQTAFHARVAAAVLGIVERELMLGPQADAAEHRRLQRLLGPGDTDDQDLRTRNAELARRLRGGELDGRRDEVVAHLRATVEDKLRIANPRYASGHDRQG